MPNPTKAIMKNGTTYSRKGYYLKRSFMLEIAVAEKRVRHLQTTPRFFSFACNPPLPLLRS
jgi:hypothetical protein